MTRNRIKAIGKESAVWLIIYLFFFLCQIRLSLDFAIWDAFLVLFSLMAIFYGNIYLRNAAKKNNTKYRIKSFGLVLLFAVVSLSLEQFLNVNQHYELENTSADWYVLFSIAIFVTFYTASLLASEFLYSDKELTKKNIALINLEKAHSDSQLQLLRSKIDPHFLFNSMNVIYTMSYLEDKRTPEKIMLLSDMLRYVLYDCDRDLVPVTTEIDYLKGYIELHELRNKNNNNIQFTIQSIDNPEAKVAPMILLPFVENAFKHSHITRDKFGFINIKLMVHKNRLSFSVDNSVLKSQKKDPTFTSKGIGMTNVKNRLKLQYPQKYDLDINHIRETYSVSLGLNLN